MTLEEVEKIIQEHIELITVDSKGISEARERSAKFLIAQSLLAHFLKNFEEEKAKIVTLRETGFAQSLRDAEGKSITEKKVFAHENPVFSNFREATERMDGIKDYIRTHMKIFENAHLTFRQLCRE